MDTIQHNPARLYNCDETGITTVQHKHKKIWGLKDKRQVSSVQSAERGSLVTVANSMGPTGHFIPPLLAFPRKNMKQELMNDTPPGSIQACHPSGLLQSEIFFFFQWLLHFIKHTKSTKEDSVHMVGHPRCVFINYIWLNHLSNTTNLWWIDVYYLVINYMFRRLWPSSG